LKTSPSCSSCVSQRPARTSVSVQALIPLPPLRYRPVINMLALAPEDPPSDQAGSLGAGLSREGHRSTALSTAVEKTTGWFGLAVLNRLLPGGSPPVWPSSIPKTKTARYGTQVGGARVKGKKHRGVRGGDGRGVTWKNACPIYFRGTPRAPVSFAMMAKRVGGAASRGRMSSSAKTKLSAQHAPPET
jgi:hypothetical protein